METGQALPYAVHKKRAEVLGYRDGYSWAGFCKESFMELGSGKLVFSLVLARVMQGS